MALGVTLDEDKDEDADVSFTVDGLPIVIEKDLYTGLKEVTIGFDPEKGIVVDG